MPQKEFDVSLLRLETLLLNLKDGALLEDQNRKIIFVNPNFINFFLGDDHSTQLLGLDCRLVAESTKKYILNPEQFISRIDFLIQNKKPSMGDEIETIDGKIFSRDFIPVRQDDNFYGNLWLYKDITEEKNNLKVLKNSERALIEMNSFKDKIFSIISHELRGPLASLKGLVDLINDGDIKFESTVEFFKTLANNLDYTFQLLNNLLYWSANHLKKRDFIPEKINLYESINSTLESLEPIITAKMMSISNEVGKDIHIYFEPESLSIVLRNILSNGLKYTQKSGNIRLYTVKQSEGSIDLHISDSGIGMDENEIKNLFIYKSFHSKLGTNREKGAGFGLILCNELMELNHGKISVVSMVKKGSDFTLTLPTTPIEFSGF